MKINEIKQRYRLESLLLQYGVELKKSGNNYQARCPFNKEDKTASFRITTDKQLYNCFCSVCNSTGGDVITAVQKFEGVSKADAMKKLSNGAFVPFQNHVKQTNERKVSVSKTTILKDIVRIYSNTLKTSKPAQAYLESRGLNNKEIWRHFEIGYCHGGALRNAVSPDTSEQLKALGVLNDKQNESFYKCIVIPIRTDRGIPVGLYGRSIDGDRHHYLKSTGNDKRKGVFNGATAKNHKTLIITESIIDALSFIERDFLNVTCIWGAQGWTEDHTAFIQNHNFEEIIFALDRDKAGTDAIFRLKEKVESYVERLSKISLPKGIKDVNEFLCNGAERDDFQKLIDERNSLFDESKSTPEQSNIVEPIEKTKEHITFKFDELYYQVKLAKSNTLEILKAVITVKTTDHRYTDSVNLYAARLRSSFATAVSNKLNVQAAKVEDDLYKVIAYVEHVRLIELEKRNRKEETSEMSERDKFEALQFLKSKGLIKTILKDVESVGYVGQAKEVLLLYTSFISTLTDSQIHVSIQSSSSSGKSEMLLKVSSLLPPERVQLLSRMSSQSLYYGDALDGKVIILDERSAADEQGQLALRSLMSRGKLSLNVVQRDPTTGQSRTESIHISARCCIWDADTDTTTEDNLNRAFQIHLDESVKQTKLVHAAQLSKFSSTNWGQERDLQKIKRKHHKGIRLLKFYRVEIPYSDKISFPIHNMRSRRDFMRFLNLLSCVTLLHQYQRPILKTEDGVEYIQANLSDYEYAYKMLNSIIEETYSTIQKESRDLYKTLLQRVKAEAKREKIQVIDFTFNRRSVREWTGWSEWKCRRALKELSSYEILLRVSGKNGSAYSYRIADLNDDLSNEGHTLMTPEQLKQVI